MLAKRLLKSLSIVLSLYVMTVYAQTPAEQLSGLLNNYQTLQANFIQKNYDARGALMQTSTGKLLLKRPGYFRWDAYSPMKQTILTDGKKVWIYDIDLEQATVQPMEKASGQTPAALLTDSSASLLAAYHISSSTKNNAPEFTLIPKEENALFNKIVLTFNGPQLTQMNIVDNLGQITQIQFNKLKINTPIDLTMFKLNLPASVDVIGQKQS